MSKGAICRMSDFFNCSMSILRLLSVMVITSCSISDKITPSIGFLDFLIFSVFGIMTFSDVIFQIQAQLGLCVLLVGGPS